jgi:hypothetical protein
MKREISLGIAIACALAIGVAAQQAPASSAPAQDVSFSGCVERDSAGPSGSGAMGNPAGNPATTQGAFKLTKATQVTGPKTNEEGKDVRMLGKGKDVDLSKHVGHKVEVMGAFATGTSSGGMGTGGTPTNPRSGADNPNSSASKDTMRRIFEVTALKMIAAKCDTQ